MTIRAKANGFNFLISTFVALGSFTYGYNTAASAAVIGLPTFYAYFNIDVTTSSGGSLAGAINAVFFAGGAVGCWIVPWLADRLGRVRCMQIISIICILSAALQTGSVHIAMLLVGRLINGIGVGMFNCIVPTYQSEIAPAAQRGRLVGIHGIFITSGVSAGAWTSFGCYFEKNIAIQLPLYCYSLVASGFPSPLVGLSVAMRMQRILESLHKTTADVEASAAHIEYLQIKDQLSLEAQEQVKNFFQIMKKPHLRKRMLCAFGLQVLLQSTGVLVIANYQILLYKALGVTGWMPILLISIYNIIASFSNWVNSLMIDRFGRIKIMAVGLIGCSISVACYTAMVALYVGTNNRVGNAMGIFFLFLFIVPYAGCLDASSYVYCTEIFPTYVRARGVGFATSGIYLAALVYTQVAPVALSTIGWRYFLIFIICPVIGTFFLVKFCPETKGLTLEEISGTFGDVVALEVAGRSDGELMEMDWSATKAATHHHIEMTKDE